MAVEELTTDQKSEQYALLKESREWQDREKEKERQLQRDLKQMDIDGQVMIRKLENNAATARLKATTRVDVFRRLGLALIKLPVLPLVVLLVFTLEVLKCDAPENLENFMDL